MCVAANFVCDLGLHHYVFPIGPISFRFYRGSRGGDRPRRILFPPSTAGADAGVAILQPRCILLGP